MPKEMTGVERVTAAIELTGPDRLPHKHCFLPATVRRYPGIIQLLQEYPSDFADDGQYTKDMDMSGIYRLGQWTDEWGCVWTNVIEGIMGQVTGHPLSDFNKLNNYLWPRAKDADLTSSKELTENRSDKYLLLSHNSLTLFERLVDLRGFENAMMDIAEVPPEFLEMRDRIVEYNLEIIDRLLELEPDGIYLSDDWGSQKSLMIDPESWRELYLPCYQKMFSRVRQAGKHVFYHTDGYTIDILSDLVEAGAQVFWVDLTVNPLQTLHNELGGKVCFLGLTDVQFTMRWGSPIDVENHGKELIKALAVFDGGFIACSESGPDQPWENIKAIYKTFFQYGRYPINIK